MFNILRKLTSTVIATSMILVSSSALADGTKVYEVTITNLTNAIVFTPILVASHKKRLAPLFELGSPASDGMTAIAEDGDISLLVAYLEAMDDVVVDVENSGGLLQPGAYGVASDAYRVFVAGGCGLWPAARLRS